MKSSADSFRFDMTSWIGSSLVVVDSDLVWA